MTTNNIPCVNSLTMMSSLKSYLTTEEELAFMQLLFSSTASMKGTNYGLQRSELEKILQLKNNDYHALHSFISRLNEAIQPYFKVIYDERHDRVVAMMRVTASNAKSTLSHESLAILLYMFYEQEVLGHAYTPFHQMTIDFGQESLDAQRKMKKNINQLKKMGAVENYTAISEESYQLTAIGVHLFSDSFLHRTAEFAQEAKLNKEEVLKFFNRYNLYVEGEE